jgi:rhamnopyranosyl-N-acetylglucosaminyl-diphospho-decaprenol beta-1,3/1,4-galactofuranosyltransferase
MVDEQHKYKIAAVVVTYNRLILLQECIASLRNQTHKLDDIIVVNNSSTDGTVDWLKEQKDLTVITQDNSGSAGGQFTGIKTAYEKRYDWIWCMDDDCRASLKALSELVDNFQPNTILNSLVLSKTNPKSLAFGIYDLSDKIFYKEYSELAGKKRIEYASLFNGTLFPSEVVKKIGLPIQDLFIKGEEIEYFHRVRKNNFNTHTIISSHLVHPPSNVKLIKTIFFNHRFEFLDHTKRFYRARNFVYNYKTYHNFSFKSFLKILFIDLFGIIFYQKSFEIFLSNIKGLIKGLTANYKVKFPEAI